MSSTQQPKALRLAHTLSGGKLIDDSTEWADTLHAAAAELRHQHTRIEELEAQLYAAQPPETAPVQMPEPAGWRDPTNLLPSQGCTYMRAIHEKWPHIYREPLYTEQQVRALLVGVSAPTAQEGWCDGCSPDNCCGCGPAAPAQVQPKQVSNSHD